MSRRRLAAIAVMAIGLSACSDSSDPAPAARSYRMGFSPVTPRFDSTLLLPVLTLAAAHSDVGLHQLSIPWEVLLSGAATPADEVRIVRLPLAQYYRATGRPVVVALDVTDGLNRAQESPELIAAGRSITEPVIQRLYIDYVAAVDSIIRPEYLSLAAETNLIRLAAPAPVYQAVVDMTNAAANDRRALGSQTPFLISVQVEVAWNRLGGPPGPYVGIAQDRTDFPFINALGLSSYPYLGGFTDPADIPDDYFSRLVAGAPLPLLVLEGGWPSVSAGGVNSTPALQAAYIARQAALLDGAGAVALFQITFTDLDLSAIPVPPGSVLPLFAHLGLVDSALNPKPALTAWDAVFARRLRE